MHVFFFMVFFFCFKQKTAYEIRLSLVGSEMCIRDTFSRLPLYHWKTPGEAMINNAAAEMAMKANTPQPSGRSKSFVSTGSVPGGPAMQVATTGSDKSLASRAITTACAAKISPTPTFHQRNRPRRVSVAASRLGSATAAAAFMRITSRVSATVKNTQITDCCPVRLPINPTLERDRQIRLAEGTRSISDAGSAARSPATDVGGSLVLDDQRHRRDDLLYDSSGTKTETRHESVCTPRRAWASGSGRGQYSTTSPLSRSRHCSSCS